MICLISLGADRWPSHQISLTCIPVNEKITPAPLTSTSKSLTIFSLAAATINMTLTQIIIIASALALPSCHAFTTGDCSTTKSTTTSRSSLLQTSATTMNAAIGNLHGQSSCFLPLLQNDEDYIAPRIVQVRSHHPLSILLLGLSDVLLMRRIQVAALSVILSIARGS